MASDLGVHRWRGAGVLLLAKPSCGPRPRAGTICPISNIFTYQATIARSAKREGGFVSAGYSVSGVDDEMDQVGGNGVDYSIKDKGKDFQPDARKISEVINRVLGTNLKPRKQSTADPGYFGV